MAVYQSDTYTVTFTDTSLLGAGIARLEGLVLFCQGAVAGDTAEVQIKEVKKHYSNAQLVRIITPSADRIPPDCTSCEACGGCQFRHIRYDAEARCKDTAVRGALRQFTNTEWNPIFTASPHSYRNKTVFHLDKNFRAGYYAASTNTHIQLPKEGCALLPSLFTQIANCTYQSLEQFREIPLRALAIRQSINGTFTAVLHADKILAEVRLAAKQWAEHLIHQFPNQTAGLFLADGMPEERSVHYELLSGNEYLTDEFLGLQLRISPAAFYQVNHDVAEALCTTVARYAALKPGECAADLYCGTGTIGLTLASLSPQASVIGIEINESAVQNAVTNAARNNLTNIRFRCGDSSTAEKENLHFDCIVIDPPRKGCSPQMIEALNRLSPNRIVYVSCNPATLARDVKSLTSMGWELKRAQAFDMFPRTGHVETCVLLSRP